MGSQKGMQLLKTVSDFMFKGKHFAATMKKVTERCFYKIPLKLHLTFTQIY